MYESKSQSLEEHTCKSCENLSKQLSKVDTEEELAPDQKVATSWATATKVDADRRFSSKYVMCG